MSSHLVLLSHSSKTFYFIFSTREGDPFTVIVGKSRDIVGIVS